MVIMSQEKEEVVSQIGEDFKKIHAQVVNIIESNQKLADCRQDASQAEADFVINSSVLGCGVGVLATGKSSGCAGGAVIGGVLSQAAVNERRAGCEKEKEKTKTPDPVPCVFRKPEPQQPQVSVGISAGRNHIGARLVFGNSSGSRRIPGRNWAGV
jgi:hypothetical protein